MPKEKAETVFNIKKLERWSSENPKLYEVIVSSANDRVEEQIGFLQYHGERNGYLSEWQADIYVQHFLS